MQEKRLAKLEAGLEGKEKVLAWLHVNQQQGGFLDVTTRYIETNGASRRPLDIEDVESRFIYLCSVACNMRALELQEARLQKGLLALCVDRFLHTDYIPPDELIQLQTFRHGLKIFVLQWMLLDRVVKIISEEHFSGIRVLYDDTAAILKKDLETAEIFLSAFNVKIAPRLGIEPLTSPNWKHVCWPTHRRRPTQSPRWRAPRLSWNSGTGLPATPCSPRRFAGTSRRPRMDSGRLLPTTEHLGRRTGPITRLDDLSQGEGI